MAGGSTRKALKRGNFSRLLHVLAKVNPKPEIRSPNLRSRLRERPRDGVSRLCFTFRSCWQLTGETPVPLGQAALFEDGERPVVFGSQLVNDVAIF